MRGCPLIVLKFGGSVLRDEDSLSLAVHEIYRWRRDGYRVVAVVSALAGVTDSLLAQSRRVCEHAAAGSIAALAGLGELQSAALLGLHLDRAGVAATMLPPGALKLQAEGSPLDAVPIDLCACGLQSALHRDGVVVVAGFVAEDAQGRAVVLGRGGSDLTALFLAHRLGADRCRLVKDVDGLYDRDPSQPGPPARRYARASWAAALETDGSIVQHKAVRFAARHGIAFELGCLNGCGPTLIGSGETSFAEDAAPSRRLRIALYGLGTVGGGVYRALRRLESFVDIVSIAVRDVDKPRQLDVPQGLLTDCPDAVAEQDFDLAIEAIGGVEPARSVVAASLRRGKHVVTANKRLIAEHGDELRELATSNGCLLRYSAAVGGSMPLLENIRLVGSGVRSVRAVLNGTTNYVLGRIADGCDFDAALREAQTLGLAEADASRDLDGRDAADKLCVVAGELGMEGVRPDGVRREPLSRESVAAALASQSNGDLLRHVATLSCEEDGVQADVRLVSLRRDDVLAAACAEHNAAVIEWTDGRSSLVRGKGAGRWPTTEAVVADVLEIVRTITDGAGDVATTASGSRRTSRAKAPAPAKSRRRRLPAAPSGAVDLATPVSAADRRMKSASLTD